MSVDFEKINEYITQVKQLEATLEERQELFDPDKLYEFRSATNELIRNIEMVRDDSRNLRIGIVGAVKAGKSSFLNAVIFGGEEYLPKAATPMTAALTKITYSESPKAIIHFYTKEDWNKIEYYSKLYDEAVQQEYDKYCKKMNQSSSASFEKFKMKLRQKLTMEEFAKQFRSQSEVQQGAHELTTRVTDKSLLKKLGETDVVEGDIISKLDDYVGAKGRYTPIVSYVELQVNNPNVKGYEIVDTPGLNDPVVSRGLKTREFLSACDVVILLSPCSQFMDADTVNLMASGLPENRVRELMIVGSKLDSGILNESEDNFMFAYKMATESYRNQFAKNLALAKETGRFPEMLSRISEGNLRFVSSMCYTIGLKLKKGQNLLEEEQLVYDNLHHRFHDFKDDRFLSLGGFNNIASALQDVLNRKNEIIRDKNSSILLQAKSKHFQTLEIIHKETTSSRMKLQTASVDELKSKSDKIKVAIESSRKKLRLIFENAAIKCSKKCKQILPVLVLKMGEHQNINTESVKRDTYETRNSGFLGWNKETVHYEVIEKKAETREVSNNIREYIVRCQQYVNQEFEYLFNKDELKQKIKEVLLKAFQNTDKEFDEDDVLSELENFFENLIVPRLEFDSNPYLDEVGTRFRAGYARNNEIHELSALQTKLLERSAQLIKGLVTECIDKIEKTLTSRATDFADQIEKMFCEELERLQNQVKERERYLWEYDKFVEFTREAKRTLSGY